MNLQTTIDLDIKSFLQWWGRELAFLIPQKLKQLLSDRSGNLVFTVTDQGFNVELYRDAESKPVFSQNLDSEDRDGYEALKKRYPDIQKADRILRLTDAEAIKKIIYLPAAAQENLGQVVGFELDRYTPFKPEQVYFSVVPIETTEEGQLKVLLVLTRRESLDAKLDQLNAWFVRPSRVEYLPLIGAIPPHNLQPFQPGSNKLAQSIHWLLSGVMMILLLAVLVFPVWHEKQAVDLLKNQIKALEKETRIVDEQQLKIDALRDETQRLINIKEQTPEMAAVLNELSRLLKDDTWLTHLQYSETHMQIQGQSPAASGLISVLEASPFFSKVSFASPLTQDKTTGLERFQISMDVGTISPQPGQSETEQEPVATDSAEPESTESAAPEESGINE